MLDWIFEGIVNWVASVVTAVMDAVSGIFLNALGTDMVAMEEYFPFVAKAFTVLQYTAWALLFFITIWELFRAFGGPLTEAENPWHLIARSAIFALLIGYAHPIFMIVLNIARAPYTALMDASMASGSFTFAGVENVLASGMVTLVSGASVVGLLLQVILMIALGWNYFKLLLEVVERYIVVGVLCYTSPLAFAAGGAKAMNKVFQSWCRMIGSQLLLLVMNVWFLRAFNSSVGQFTANGGALTNGHGNIFLWMFCALAFLKTAQKFDSYLASLGLSVAQTGSGMGMEMLMGLRVITGMAGGGHKGIGGMFRGGGSSAAGGAVGGAAGAAGAGGFMAGLASKFRGNSYVRDAVVDGGSRIGAGGSVGLIGRTFGGMAARTGAELTGDSISSVAARPAAVSGSIAGEIADRSLKNYMPHMSDEAGGIGIASGTDNAALSGVKYSNTQITGGHISTTATTADGKTSDVDMYSAQYDRPAAPHSVVNASDGSMWYQTATGEGAGAFYPTPQFTGDASEAAQVAEAFPGAAEGTSLRMVDDGVLEASHPDGGNSLWYNSAIYQEPDAPHGYTEDSNGVGWYTMQPQAALPGFDTGAMGAADGGVLPAQDTLPSRVGGCADGGAYSLPSSKGTSFAPGAPEFSMAHSVDGAENASIIEMPRNIGGDGGDLSGEALSPADAPKIGETPVAMSSAAYGGSATHGATPEDMPPQADAPAIGAMPVATSPNVPDGMNTDVGGVAMNSAAMSSTEISGTATGNAAVPDSAEVKEAAAAYNLARFHQFMPGYEQQATQLDLSRSGDGQLEVRHADGSGTAFYDKAQYQQPRGDFKLYEDSHGGQWYALQGKPAVERVPVYENGKPVYEGESVKTVNVETVKYPTAPTKFEEPQKRNMRERKPPNPKKR